MLLLSILAILVPYVLRLEIYFLWFFWMYEEQIHQGCLFYVMMMGRIFGFIESLSTSAVGVGARDKSSVSLRIREVLGNTGMREISNSGS